MQFMHKYTAITTKHDPIGKQNTFPNSSEQKLEAPGTLPFSINCHVMQIVSMQKSGPENTVNWLG